MSQILFFLQLFLIIVMGLYFFNALKGQQGGRIVIQKESKKEMEKLQKMREIKLTKPLSELKRP